MITMAAWPRAVSPTPTPTTPSVAISRSTWKSLAAMARSRPGGSKGAWAAAGVASSSPRRAADRYVSFPRNEKNEYIA